MTTREFFTAVLNAHINDEMDAAAIQLIQKLDAKNAKRKSADTKQKREVADRRTAVREFFVSNPNKPFTRDEVAAAIGITPAAVSNAASAMVGEGLLVRGEVKVDKNKRTCYTYKVGEDAEDAEVEGE